jgi:translation elongation factor EF-1alpha
MGRIALRDGEETIAAGFITEFFYWLNKNIYR